jgi:hypothetical protein
MYSILFYLRCLFLGFSGSVGSSFAFTPIGQSLLKLDESQRKRRESLFNTAYSVVKTGKPFSDYELICEIQVKNDFLSILVRDDPRKFINSEF